MNASWCLRCSAARAASEPCASPRGYDSDTDSLRSVHSWGWCGEYCWEDSTRGEECDAGCCCADGGRQSPEPCAATASDTSSVGPSDVSSLLRDGGESPVLARDEGGSPVPSITLNSPSNSLPTQRGAGPVRCKQGHNNWDCVEQRKEVLKLRCRTCREAGLSEFWWGPRDAVLKCRDLFRRATLFCQDGDACERTHVHRYRNKEKEVRVHNQLH
eukprot:Hpha_TRINITY_DN15311_c3_g5::TRINITY_DN15311_c3_g5_i2::g.88665::m.88665